MTDPRHQTGNEAFATDRPLSDQPLLQPSLANPPLYFWGAGFQSPRSTDEPPGRTTEAWPEISEMRTAHAIRRVLDQGTERLPCQVTERLATARQQALARILDSPEPIRIRPSGRSPAESLPRSDTSLAMRWQLGALAVSAMVLAGVFILVDTMKEDQSVEDLAEVDSALLTDDLPLDAWADRGFGVYMVNTRLPRQQTVSFNSRR